MKPQVNTPKPPQFQGSGIDARRALLILGVPAAAVLVTLLVLFATPLVWWIAAGVAATGAAGGVLLRRSDRARGIARRLPGVQRAAAGLRRMPNGRFARSPLGRAVNRALGRSQAGGRAGGAGRSAGGRLRAMLPSWAGGTRNRPTARPGGAGSSPAGGRPGGRMRAMLSRLTPGGRRRPTTTGGPAGRPGGRPGAVGAGGRPQTRAGRAWARITSPFRPGGRPGGKPGAKPSPAGSRTTPGNKPPAKPGAKPGAAGPISLAAVRTGAGQAGRLLGRGMSALFGRFGKRKKTDPDDDFETYETGIEGTAVDGKYLESDLGEIAERAKEQAAQRIAEAARRAKKRAKKAKKDEPEWPNVEPHDGSWPTTDPDDGVAPPPERSLPAERDHDPPGRRRKPNPGADAFDPKKEYERQREIDKARAASRRTAPLPQPPPRYTSHNYADGGRPMGVSPTKYNDLITSASSRQEGWQAAADAFRQDSAELTEKAAKHDRAAEVFDKTGNTAAAEERRESARQLRDDANACLVYAGEMQTEARAESTPAA